ncbi:phage tail sheath subtilisin-like domain-containing protein [Laribacter hongkongensis]|uniref:phage tail sheath subtilisin-like domain-containing protein n=2 Tax=Laribacter hongkongensis TaxID=168471 RepID=UPI001EFD23DF|nr:phage tail sheath subtilisin-like domain-containing protein [Laribacter hongkongensis]MCG8993215.1 phage tail sheath subtilisin-like domain-containing protein [Laribacter hongkongensis]MCG8997966.1 phage tail sheath subtilisin-like domain-containing protein [Laribacter hongkongensis]MCG9002323.1 phage tail sheath subtilisin-like domain-containing protein [Laribacter hongkongensis]MCG9005633.1 phage tail sheath subtilisin-like domain-containing protein [Laribacter hongkongensis]MCG9008770.1 
MASPNISFDSIPASIRKPGKYFEFNTRLAVRTLPGNPQKVLVLGQKLAAGSQAALAPVDVFSDEQAAALFGRGSQLHLMARAAIKANPYLQLTAVAIADPAGNAATGILTLTGSATGSGVLSQWVGANRIDVAVSNGDTAAMVATALAAAITARADLPVSSVAAAGVVTHTAVHKGTFGNDIKLAASCSAPGLTTAVAAMAGGTLEADYTATLAAVAGAGHHIIVAPQSTQALLTVLRTHLEFVSGPMEQRGAIGVFGWPGSLATGTTLTGQINSGRITGAWHRGSLRLPCEIAAAYAAVLASEEDPARPLNTLELAGLDVTGIDQRPLRTEQENALYNGLTPLEIGPGDRVQIVRAISTYTKDAQGVADVSLLDITTIRTLDYVRRACRERISLRFPREKLSERTPDKVRSELLDVLFKLEELEIVEAVEANKDGLIVERDSQDVNRLNAKIPTDVVNGLHVFAGRIDLLL